MALFQSSHNMLTPNALTTDALTVDENVSFNDIFDDNMINEINNYESESSDDEYYVDPLRDDLDILADISAVSSDSDDESDTDKNTNNDGKKVSKVSASTLSKRRKAFQKHLDKATEELTYFNMSDNMKVEYDNELKMKCDCHFFFIWYSWLYTTQHYEALCIVHMQQTPM